MRERAAQVMFGTASLGNLYAEPAYADKKAVRRGRGRGGGERGRRAPDAMRRACPQEHLRQGAGGLARAAPA
jgi:hypothetical protein